mmetsp:Transcript_13357/g.25639  ORF Transcript_13357/g.25639 Transcript_13357/m.25639 type:complete len:216 (+) Transcript_13357:253-900(+)|eukprot:CAMPEP_0114257334 /NCGR_PEP_ID=MMETSP0058-20121206/18668_1 /TAXON_ID=36894 /ORGANISM="Pyramimonas parkeae, CCMP726" /LENGTH=215 /DNA_ID=CAMNT_0001372035 /DNA_START=253 /DNA_END=900 /DNA_ORIENTATION=-
MDSKSMDQIFNLKFAAKQMQRQAKKSEKDEKSEKGKVKKAIEKGNMEGAKIYAQNAIRKKTEQTNYLKFGSQLDAVVSRLQSQANMSMITKNMAGIVKSLDKALASNNMEQVATTMDNFEKQFSNLDVQANYVEQAMGNSTAMSTPQDQVDMLIQQVADEHNLSLAHSLPNAGITIPVSQAVAAGPASTPAQAMGVEVDESDDLMRRLAELRARK